MPRTSRNEQTEDFSAYPPRSEQYATRWRKGQPVVVGAEDDIELWERLHADAYVLDNLKNIYKWAQVFRGGIIPIYDRKIFMVREKDRVIIDDYEPENAVINDNGDFVIPGLYGFPKGAADYECDTTIIDTAIREYEEEVKVATSPGDLWYPSFIYVRPKVGEVLAFFPIIYDHPPDFQINLDELSGGGWYSLQELAPLRGQMSVPTRALLYHLGCFAELSA